IEHVVLENENPKATNTIKHEQVKPHLNGKSFIEDGKLIGILPRMSWNMIRMQKIKSNRSEEHTSELQSRFDLVCRLMLEKKNKLYSSLYIFHTSRYTLFPYTTLFRSIEHVVLENENPKATNTIKHEQVKPHLNGKSFIEDGKLIGILPRMSWNMIRMQKIKSN